ncbi:Protein of unknown function [Actinopolyspora lacussalsi subsp. righensis]|uniref:DUF3558 domain-containing protein n=1 Tax=Actinopolyspora righensis TaxID=995060 RepID=A0A1I7C024_9ACTN|nr:DUF3558 family protein [Actinopolyspora righensis]SFT92764.1 Protein of unknown function [Actinopolyspora righensis]
MIGRALRVTAVLLAGLGVISACGSSDRPKELSVSDVKPCELISQSARERLQVRAQPQSRDAVAEVDTEGSTCYFSPYDRSNVWLSVVTNHGIGRWSGDGPFDRSKSKEVSRIQGFRTVKVWFDGESPNPDHKCRIYVDVAAGKSLRVQVDESFTDEDPSTCTTARRFAEAAMQSLAA